MYTTAVWVGMIETFVCANSTYFSSISHDSACPGRQEDVVILHWNINSFAAVQVQFDQQNYTVIEGNMVSITLVTNTSDYMFNFTVTLQYMDGTATGECLTEPPFTRTLKGILTQLIMKYIL